MSSEKARQSEDGHHCDGQTAPEPLPEVDFEEFVPSDYEAWKEAAVAALKGAPFEKAMYTSTYEGITLDPLYTASDTQDLRAARTFPGSYPLRGASAAGNLRRPWEIAQFCDETLPGDAHEGIVHELDRGASTVAFVLDGRTLEGLDADSDAAEDGGVSVSSLDDLDALLGDLPARHPLYIHAGASALPLLALLDALAAKRKIPLGTVAGCVGADPLGALLERGSLPTGLDALFGEMAQTFAWARDRETPLRTVLIRGSVFHNGGASAVQEVACAMTSAIETLRALRERGVDVAEFSRRLRFEFSLSSNFFMEIAKLRAARCVWAQIVSSFGGDAEAQKAQIFGRTSLFTKTVYDPYVNMLRNTTEAFSGVVGGVDGLTVGRFDEALRPGSEFSRRVARNAQVLLQKEFNLLQPEDPAGGSWYVEKLTDELARKAWEELQRIEAAGGFLKSVREGVIQRDIQSVLQQRFKRLAQRADRAVGTNMYPNPAEPLPEFAEPDRRAQRAERAEALRRFRAGRDGGAVERALDGAAASGTVSSAADAASAGATLGELRAALGRKGDEALSVEPILPHRWTEQYEAMRRRTEAFKAEKGDNFKVFLANMGPIPQHKARADFIASFMEVAAFEILRNDGFAEIGECAAAAAASGADIAVICSTDASYPELVPPLARAIKERCPGMGVYLAGAPAADCKDSYVEAGVDGFINIRSNCLETLTGFQRAKGMLLS
nr:methylmalonyl-CoA mutase family protein [uncultured Fretibacterium sp.]